MYDKPTITSVVVTHCTKQFECAEMIVEYTERSNQNADNSNNYDQSANKTVTRKYDYINHPYTLVILPIINNEILFKRVYRPTLDDFTWELFSISLKNDVDLVTAASELLLKETGYKTSNIMEYTWNYPNPSLSNEIVHTFLARDLISEPQDDSEIYYFTVDETMQMIQSHEIKDGKTINAVLMAIGFGYL